MSSFLVMSTTCATERKIVGRLLFAYLFPRGRIADATAGLQGCLQYTTGGDTQSTSRMGWDVWNETTGVEVGPPPLKQEHFLPEC